jgi:hypothetical protein
MATNPTNVPSSLLDALSQAKLHIDNALAAANSSVDTGSTVLAQALRAMDPTNSGCSNCSCGGGGSAARSLPEEKA